MRKSGLMLLLIVQFMIWPPLTNAQEPISLTITNWPPYFAQDLKQFGFVAKIVSAAFAEEGMLVDYLFLPNKRAFLLALNNPKWKGSVGWTRTKDREKDWYFSDAIYAGRGVFWYLKSDPFDWIHPEDLYKYKFGGKLGSTYYYLDKPIKEGKITVERVSTEEQIFDMLLAKRIQVFPASYDVGMDVLNNKFTPQERKQITYHPKPYISASAHIIFSKRHADSQRILNVFNKGLKKLKEKGTYDQIVQAQLRGEFKHILRK